MFLGAVIARLVFNYLTGFIADDAFITFRYAENLAAGKGFVYNIGDKVLGTSTPFFTLLLAFFAGLRILPVTAALFISLVSSGLTASVLYRFAQSLRFRQFAAVPAQVYILWPRSIPADTCGMETALFTLLVTSAFYFQHRQFRLYAIGMATLATVTRPEGFGLLLLLGLYNIFRDRHNWKAYLITPSIIIIPWIALSWLYFGSPIPNTIPAKLALYSRFGTEPLFDRLSLLLGFHIYYGYIMLAAAVIGGRWLYKKQYFGGLEIFWMLAMTAFYLFGRTHLFFWYMAPVFPIYILFAAAVIPFSIDRINCPAHRCVTYSRVVSVLIILILLAGNYLPTKNHHETQQTLEGVHRQVGYYLYVHADQNDLVAAEDIGYIGYFSQRKILDRDGLVSPEAVPYNRDGRYRDLILDKKPDWVVLSNGSPLSEFASDSLFINKYEIKKSFAFDKLSYSIYSRMKETESEK
ncbi:MAG: hypothetical protein ACOYVF_14860 [Candidatus Zixiibacteriota bacterium]